MYYNITLRSVESNVKITKIIANHSYIEDNIDFTGKALTKEDNINIKYTVFANDNVGDGVIIDANGEELKITWDYEDIYNYSPKIIPSNGKYILIREDKGGRYLFKYVVISKEKAENMALQAMDYGESETDVQHYIGFSLEKLKELKSQYLKKDIRYIPK